MRHSYSADDVVQVGQLRVMEVQFQRRYLGADGRHQAKPKVPLLFLHCPPKRQQRVLYPRRLRLRRQLQQTGATVRRVQDVSRQITDDLKTCVLF